MVSTSTPSSSSSNRRLMSGMSAILTTCLVLIICLNSVHGFVAGSRPLSKRSFFDIQCKGVYDKGIFARLDRVCDDCYNLYREPQLHSLCSENCFSTKTFAGCLDALRMADEYPTFRELIATLHADTSNSLSE